MSSEKTDRIRWLNDEFRRTLVGGKVTATIGVDALSPEAMVKVLDAITTFNDFTLENDPHGEHTFGRIEVEGHTIVWKISYYDPTQEFGSEDPSDPTQTERVMTIMLAEEY